MRLVIHLLVNSEKLQAELSSTCHAKKAAAAAVEKKAVDVVLIDMTSVSIMADYFLVCTVYTEAHARGVREAIEESMEESKLALRRREGSDASGWVLLDWGDIVVHIFREEERKYYDLEGLWGDAPAVRVGDSSGADDAT